MSKIEILSKAINALPLPEGVLSINISDTVYKHPQVHMASEVFLKAFESFTIARLDCQYEKISKVAYGIEFFALVHNEREKPEPRACTKKELFGGVK